MLTREDPPLAAAIVYYSSREAWERYRGERLPALRERIYGSWGPRLAFEHRFRVEDI